KEWAYAGFAITFVSAFIAHTASGDPVSYRFMPLLMMALLIASYISYHRLHHQGVASGLQLK
ncbi:MAG TPA: DoxX family protein, partial [Puia sp.]|nr:DoxX family protein [Puia sp.]